MLMTGILFLALAVAVAGLAIDGNASPAEEDRKEPPQG